MQDNQADLVEEAQVLRDQEQMEIHLAQVRVKEIMAEILAAAAQVLPALVMWEVPAQLG